MYQCYKEYDADNKDPKAVEAYWGPNTVLPHLEIPENVRTFLKSKPKRPPNYSVKEMRKRYEQVYHGGVNIIRKL